MYLISYIAFGNSKATFMDKVIAFLSFGKYSHSEIVFSNGRSFSISPRDDTARFKNIDINSGHWSIIKLNITIDEEDIIMKNCESFRHLEYDYLGALLSPIRLCLFNSKNKTFCSKLIVGLLKDTEEYNYLGKDCSYSPNRVYNSII